MLGFLFQDSRGQEQERVKTGYGINSEREGIQSTLFNNTTHRANLALQVLK